MNKLTICYLKGCPYCKNAKKAYDALLTENETYKDVKVEWIEESENAAIADKYDYYRVPTIFMGEDKLYEAAPSDSYDTIKAKLKAALDAVQ